MFNTVGGNRLGEHAVYPGTFDPITPGHLDIIERARHFFARITVLLAVNGDKQSATTQSERAIQLRQELPANWDNVSVTAIDPGHRVVSGIQSVRPCRYQNLSLAPPVVD